MPLFKAKSTDKGTFAGTMGAALGKHRMEEKEKGLPPEDGDKEKKVSEHLDKASEHIAKARDIHVGGSGISEDDDAGGETEGSALEALGLGGREED
jgi:hypothetical protein